MLQPTYPGVYTRELPSGVRTISGAPTSVALFVGPTRSGIDLRPVRIRNFGDFERQFGGLAATSSLSYSVMHFFGNGGGEAFVPQISLLVAFALLIVTTAVLVYFLHHIPASIRIDTVLEAIGRRLLRQIATRYPEEGSRDPARRATPQGEAICAQETGYVRVIELDTLCEVAARHDHPGALVQADNILREIRLIKSPLEQALMARAAKANVDALNAVGQAVRAGAVHHELMALFRLEAAKRGNGAVFLNVDRVSSDLSRATIADGQTLMIDGVSQFMGYHGDFARTVFVGDPTREAQAAAKASAFGWQAVREKLRPGMRFSEIVKTGEDALKAAGHTALVGFGPHSCGLAHTDEPGEVHGGFWRKPDIILQPGMILSVDCPTLDTGIGGSAHCEDLVLITEDGCEPIHPLHEPVIVV